MGGVEKEERGTEENRHILTYGEIRN